MGASSPSISLGTSVFCPWTGLGPRPPPIRALSVCPLTTHSRARKVLVLGPLTGKRDSSTRREGAEPGLGGGLGGAGSCTGSAVGGGPCSRDGRTEEGVAGGAGRWALSQSCGEAGLRVRRAGPPAPRRCVWRAGPARRAPQGHRSLPEPCLPQTPPSHTLPQALGLAWAPVPWPRGVLGPSEPRCALPWSRTVPPLVSGSTEKYVCTRPWRRASCPSDHGPCSCHWHRGHGRSGSRGAVFGRCR